ncbi:unnamed protein product, partial [Closterium sp. Naga37s-1]
SRSSNSQITWRISSRQPSIHFPLTRSRAALSWFPVTVGTIPRTRFRLSPSSQPVMEFAGSGWVRTASSPRPLCLESSAIASAS